MPIQANDRGAIPNLGYAELLQRKGFTLTEIAARMMVDRSVIVDALYTKRTADLVFVPDIEPSRRRYAGKRA